MTDILCNWLNNEVKLSRRVGKCPMFFARIHIFLTSTSTSSQGGAQPD